MSFDKEFQICTILTAKKYLRQSILDIGNVNFKSFPLVIVTPDRVKKIIGTQTSKTMNYIKTIN